MPHPTAHADAVPRSGIREIMDLAWSTPGETIGLHVGEPSAGTPSHVLEAARAALADGDTRYAPNAGIPALREAIATKLTERNGLSVTPDQIVVAAGGMQALYASLLVTAGAGDEVLIPDPGWPNFAMATALVQATPVRYPLLPEDGFQPDREVLARHVTPRTRAIVVNSPSNPLGTVLDEDLARRLCRFADEHDLWLISDECYDEIWFDRPPASPARWDEQGRVISCFSCSKTYAMTGMRVGYFVVPPALEATGAKLQESLVACVNVPAQRAAVAALEGPQEAVAEARDVYRRRRDRATALLDAEGIGYLRPDGAFYLWIDVRDRTAGDVREWAFRLVREHGVAVAPGSTFGPRGEGWIRVSLSTDEADLLEGLRRIARMPLREG